MIVLRSLTLTTDIAVDDTLLIVEVFQCIEELKCIMVDVVHGKRAILNKISLH